MPPLSPAPWPPRDSTTSPTRRTSSTTAPTSATPPTDGGGDSVTVESSEGGVAGNGSVDAARDGVEVDATGESNGPGASGAIDWEVEGSPDGSLHRSRPAGSSDRAAARRRPRSRPPLPDPPVQPPGDLPVSSPSIV